MAKGRLPRWLKLANPVIVALQRRGVVIGTMRLLSVPGRKSGKLRTTPVSPLTVEGERYILARGREQVRVNLFELPPAERGPLLREFPRKVPRGVQYFRQLYRIDGTPEELEALAPLCPVFLVEEAGP